MSHEKKKKLATKALSKLSFFFGAHTDTKTQILSLASRWNGAKPWLLFIYFLSMDKYTMWLLWQEAT